MSGEQKTAEEYKQALIDLIRVITSIEGNWISASHYWGSLTNEESERAIKAARALLNKQPQSESDKTE